MKRMVCLYIAILWVTMFILENYSIYCEKQVSFSFVVAVFDCSGEYLLQVVRAKGIPILILSLAFMALPS